MKVLLSDSFVEIPMTTGTIQNVSDNIVEISSSSNATIDNGILLKPYDMFCFSGTVLYARCYNGGGGYIRVVPFEIATSRGGEGTGDGSTILDGVLVIGSESSTVDGSIWLDLED